VIIRLKNLTSLAIFIIVFFSILQINYTANAETRPVDIVANVVPENPKPREEVTIILETYATDLNQAVIEWSAGGKVLYKEIGATDFSFVMGAMGTQSVIDVKINTNEGDIVQKRIVLTPTNIDLLWQGVNAHKPPFYKGRTLPSKEGEMRIVAIPINSSGVQTTGTTYSWSANNTPDGRQSGYNKDSFSFTLTDEQEDTISVRTNTISGGTQSSGSIKIRGVLPFISFYEKSPSGQIKYNKALEGEIFMEKDEMTIFAQPYFMNKTKSDEDTEYIWRINNEEIPTPSSRNSLTIRPSSRGGYANIDLTIENTLKLFQSAKRSLNINL
jgi:hypothetical protein